MNGATIQSEPFAVFSLMLIFFCCCTGPRVDNFQTLDPRKQELLEARFLGMRSSSNPAGGSGGAVSSNLPSLPIANSTPSCNLMAAHVQQQPSPSNLNANATASAGAATSPICSVATAPFSNYSATNSHGIPFFRTISPESTWTFFNVLTVFFSSSRFRWIG